MRSVTSIKQNELSERWFLVDAKGQRIGRIASIVAEILQGKNDPKARSYHKPMNKVVIINAKKIDFNEKKGMTKFYKTFSGFPGGLRFVRLDELNEKFPAKPLESAVKGMLPHTKRGREMMANLRVFAGAEHDHEAQTPEVININEIKL